MSEESSTVSSPDSSAVPSASPQTAGSMLRVAREASGLHVAALAVAMKVPVKKLEALEADRLDLLPDAVFVRALASSVCRALKIDPVPVLARLPRNRIPKLDTEERGINTPFHAPGESRPWSGKSFSMRPAMFIVLALLVGVALLVFIPEMQAGGDSSPEVNTPVAPLQSGTDAAGPQSDLVLPPTITNQPEALSQSEPATPGVEVVPAAPAVPSSSAVVAPVPAKAASAAEVPGLQPQSTTADTLGGQTLVSFKAKGVSWVEVIDGKGATLLRRTLSDGESASATGAMPLTVTVGRSDVTEVAVRGRPFSIANLARDNVARFEVK